LVPVFRGGWRILSRRIGPKGIFRLVLLIVSLFSFVSAMAGIWLGWNPNLTSVGFMIYMVILAVYFWIDDSPMRRSDTALFVFMIATTATLLSEQLRQAGELQEREHLKRPNSEAPAKSSN
jgi:hypothetical protein